MDADSLTCWTEVDRPGSTEKLGVATYSMTELSIFVRTHLLEVWFPKYDG